MLESAYDAVAAVTREIANEHIAIFDSPRLVESHSVNCTTPPNIVDEDNTVGVMILVFWLYKISLGFVLLAAS